MEETDKQSQCRIPDATAFAVSMLMEQSAAAAKQAEMLKQAAQDVIQEYCSASLDSDLMNEATLHYDPATQLVTF